MRNGPKATIFEMSVEGLSGVTFPELDVPEVDVCKVLGGKCRSEAPRLPEVSETDVIRHFVGLSRMNFSVDEGFYPLGSCTMKYNPKVNEFAARMPGFARIHPLQPVETLQGALKLIQDTARALSEITGMKAVTLQPAAGAHGEQTGLMLIKKYHEMNGQADRDEIIVPDSAHGTNPASAVIVGYKVVEVPSDSEGCVDLEALKKLVGPKTAGLMLTNPNTLGIFEKHIAEINEIIHSAGGLSYYDGANANAIIGNARPGDMGFDVLHLNLHKTFSTPHGGGGPGAGAVGVNEKLVPYLPVPFITSDEKGHYDLACKCSRKDSLGPVRSFYGNFGVLVRCYTYIRTLGAEGIREAGETAVLNANYLAAQLKDLWPMAHQKFCKHEFVMDGEKLKKETGVTTLDVAKAIIDAGYHPPTVYFPLIVHEAMMIEPTETESKKTLDAFVEALREIYETAKAKGPEYFHELPKTTPISRPDETTAARNPILRWQFEK